MSKVPMWTLRELTHTEFIVFIQNSSVHTVGTKGVSQLYHLSFDDNKVLKIINWMLLKVYSSVHDH